MLACDVLPLTFIAFGRTDVGADYSYVDVDGEWGIYTATRHLIERGHRRIAFLGFPLDYTYAIHRRDGFLRALRERGMPIDPDRVLVGLTNETDTRRAVDRLLALPEPPTAFVVAGDLLAIHAMSAAAQRGLLTGRDYAISGFDDLPLAAHTTPALTTIRQPFDRLADELIATLARVLAQEPGERHILLRPELIVRGSS